MLAQVQQAERPKAKIEIVPVLADNLMPYVGPVIPLLEPALAREGDVRVIDVFAELNAGRMQLWAIERDGQVIAAVVTKLVNRPLRKLLQILYVGGRNIEDWIDRLEVIEGWAKSEGAVKVEVVCREGLHPILKRRGYRRTHFVETKEL